MLSKEIVVDKIEILETGHLQVRRATYAVENGQRIGLLGYHRVAYDPGAAIDHEDARVKALAKATWTQEVVQAHMDKIAAMAA